MHYVFDTSRRLLLDDRGIAVKKLYIKRYDKIDWDIDVVGGGTSVGFTAGRFDGTGVIPLIKTSSPVSGGKATLTPQSNTSGLRDMLIIDGVMQPSVEFPGEFIVSDADGKRVASINIPVEFAAAIDSPDAVVEELGRAVITASMTTLPAGSQGTVQVEPTGNGYNFKLALPAGTPGKDGVSPDLGSYKGPLNLMDATGKSIIKLTGGKLDVGCGNVGIDIHATGTGFDDILICDTAIQLHPYDIYKVVTDGYVQSIGGVHGVITLGTGLNMTGQELTATGGSVDLSHYVKKTDYASGSQYGLVRIGSNISVSNGIISLPYASASSYGVMRAGSGLSASGGVISVQGGSGGGGVESINGQTGAVTLHLGVTTLPDNPDIHAIYLYSKDSYGNMQDASESYMIGLEGAGVSSKATSCLTVGGSLDGDTLNIQTSDGRNILSYNGSGAIMIGDTSMTVNVESEQLNLAGKNGVSVRADGTSRISIGAGGSERIDIGGSHHVISIVSTGRSGSNDALYLQGGNQSISMTYLTPATKIYGDVTVNNQPIQ